MVEAGGGRLEGAGCPRTEVGPQAEWVSRPSDLRAAGTVTCRQWGQAAWAGRGCEAANPSSDLPRTSVDMLLACPSVEAGPPPGRQDAPRDKAGQQGNSRCVEGGAGLLGKDVLTQPSKGLCPGPQNYHTPQVDPETRASRVASSESLPFPLKLRWVLWGLEPGGSWGKPTPWKVPAGLRFASAAGPMEKTGITWLRFRPPEKVGIQPLHPQLPSPRLCPLRPKRVLDNRLPYSGRNRYEPTAACPRSVHILFNQHFPGTPQVLFKCGCYCSVTKLCPMF